MVDKSDIFADEFWKEQWKAGVAKERTVNGDDVSVLSMAVQLARRWGPQFCPQCEAKSKKLLDLVDAAYKILSARREQLSSAKTTRRSFTRSNGNGSQSPRPEGPEGMVRVLEVLEDIRDGLVDLGQNNGRH